ncbi:MAG TPA: hypothetical protein VMV23_00625 [Candidatus Nanopelagicaceae bacterium]|nr:hypothetical protein [Candidatus Nanopelagicaceae bacterium]
MRADTTSATVARRLPPVAELAVGSLALIVVGGIYLAAHIPGPVSLVPAIVLWALAAALLLVNAALLSRLSGFAWGRFRQVGGWALLAYAISAGMLEYVFVIDRVPARELVWLSLMLVVYAVDIPLILAFSVARYQSSD